MLPQLDNGIVGTVPSSPSPKKGFKGGRHPRNWGDLRASSRTEWLYAPSQINFWMLERCREQGIDDEDLRAIDSLLADAAMQFAFADEFGVGELDCAQLVSALGVSASTLAVAFFLSIALRVAGASGVMPLV
jgi:hypothetical protein